MAAQILRMRIDLLRLLVSSYGLGEASVVLLLPDTLKEEPQKLLFQCRHALFAIKCGQRFDFDGTELQRSKVVRRPFDNDPVVLGDAHEFDNQMAHKDMIKHRNISAAVRFNNRIMPPERKAPDACPVRYGR